MAASFSPGTRIGEFVLEDLIGTGPLAEVYRARQPALQRTVALKVLRSDVGHDALFRTRFVREGRALARLEHEHIAAVFEAGEDGDRAFLAVEWIDGGTLRDLLTREGPLSLDRAIGILAPVGEALDHVHRAGVVHRGVQSRNIRIARDGAVYLSDFGLAADPEGQMTAQGMAVGAFDSVAPEQIRGEPVGPKTDVYGLGCVAFECLTGAPPFADREGMRILWAHLAEEVPRPSELDPALPARADAAVLRALAKDPADRPASAGEFVAELSSALGRATDTTTRGGAEPDSPITLRSAIAPGTRIGPYEVEALIGAGAMGSVYRARQPSLERVVALKVLLPQLAADDRVIARFQQEGVSLARLKHRHIVSVYGAGRDGDHLFLAMQFVEGGTLRDLLAEAGRLRAQRALPILDAVAQALDHAHSLDLVHRDVKPANVLIADDGRIFLSDFGITRTLADSANLTATGAIVGTPRYMAPEQADADAPVGPPCDIYALGCVAFECLTGSPPYDQPNHWALLMAHATADPPSASALNPSLPAEIDQVFRIALAKQPDARYAKAGDLIGALDAIL